MKAPVLETLIDYAETLGLEQSITLQVGGLIITGLIISRRDYFAGLDESLKSAAKGLTQGSDEIGNRMQRSGDLSPPSSTAEPEQRGDKCEYIHLRDCQIFLGGGLVIPSGHGTLWRGRLDSVDGFFLGQVSIRVPSAASPSELVV
jgi:hypothetical protein